MKVVRIKLSTSDSPVPQLVLAHETVPTSIPTSPPQTTPVASSSSMKPNNVIASDAFEDVTDPTVTVSTKSRSSATGSSSTKSSVTDVLSPRPLFTISNPSPDSQSSQAPEAGPTFTQEHLTSIIKQPIFTIPSSLTSLHGPRAAHIPAVTTVRALPSDNVPQLAAPVASLNPDDTGQSSKTNPRRETTERPVATSSGQHHINDRPQTLATFGFRKSVPDRGIKSREQLPWPKMSRSGMPTTSVSELIEPPSRIVGVISPPRSQNPMAISGVSPDFPRYGEETHGNSMDVSANESSAISTSALQNSSSTFNEL